MSSGLLSSASTASVTCRAGRLSDLRSSCKNNRPYCVCDSQLTQHEQQIWTEPACALSCSDWGRNKTCSNRFARPHATCMPAVAASTACLSSSFCRSSSAASSSS